MKLFRSGLLPAVILVFLTTCLGQQPVDNQSIFTISVAPPTAAKDVQVRYYFTGAFGGFGSSIATPTEDNKIVIKTGVEGKSAKSFKLIAYAPGCQFVTISVDDLTSSSRQGQFECTRLNTVQLFGHANAKVMDGGRVKWLKENRKTSKDAPSYAKTDYKGSDRNDKPIRAYRDDVLKHLEKQGQLVDVRSPEEYAGTRMHMPDYPNEGALRGGHIPSAKSVPWAKAINPDDGTFKTADELKKLYCDDNKLSPDGDTIAYCRIGERSSHTWFALKYLLGFKNVRNYDGSWTEWGNMVNVPIEK